jgi:ribonuclease PH
VALARAFRKFGMEHLIAAQVGAVSVGISGGRLLLDLNYAEDSTAEVDFNVVMLGDGRFVEVQGTAEHQAFSREQMDQMVELAGAGIRQLFDLQRAAVEATPAE